MTIYCHKCQNETVMQLIASDKIDKTFAKMLDAYDCPAILMNRHYEVLAANDRYTSAFGALKKRNDQLPTCYQVSHGYATPCDEAGESCPLQASLNSRKQERVLHIHNTPRGKEHVDVELIPLANDNGKLLYFIECLRPVKTASPQKNTRLMVGSSGAFNTMLANLQRVAPTSASVLLYGESGTGKELAARAIHQSSQRSGQAFVAVECSGLTDSLFESEMFGHIKGAFTGAINRKVGLVEAARKGTLFLDEVGDIPLSLQVKLLRLIESSTYRPVGSADPQLADFRLICATHKNLRAMVDRGEFREDLYYRINVFPIYLPNLQERRNDIPVIAESLLSNLNNNKQLDNSALQWLKQHAYRGNIRELRNILERASIIASGDSISDRDLQESIKVDQMMLTSENKVDLKSQEKQHIESLLLIHGGDKQAVAEQLNISLRTLYRKLQ